ncbi:LacI family DNA-binding transcriptional regulator [Bifidobacterium mongoliense]|uniref:Periplasmic binding protein/LacI transcriptional regulator n=1 Tax=Bifidobacterium mongoliense DSM 21395 TaxID=1437603 RepID=A0A087C7I2_9BIFI|nr:LacI family DNA-binding transcriptional regulator [Bifidobacterium mongoliense]KFI79232.1 periplasmic binding protein/LacI transcriptional regulator [Bifidobacterium mongoliense DSM 21395]MDN5633347.1 LacI family DNA-binding transcriptional regulator [Bifidobacterium mongoliense]
MAYATIRDVARLAGVSVSTVSRALNTKGRISEHTKLVVEQAMKELGYIPDSRAQAMRSSKTGTVGLLVPDIRNPYFADLAYTIQDALFGAGYCTFIGTSSENADQQDSFIMSILSQRIDGAILVPQGGDSHALRLLIGRKLPLVFVDRQVEGLDTIPVVDSDPIPGLTEALEDIRAHGCSKVGYVSGPVLESPTLQEREYVFRELAAMAFGEDHVFVESTGFDQSSCVSVLRRMRRAGVGAVIFGYSPDAVRAVSLMHDNGIRVGLDISIVSFDDLEMFRLTSPHISVISQQVRRIGAIGAQTFLDMVVGHGAAGSHRVETTYIPRESVGRMR